MSHQRDQTDTDTQDNTASATVRQQVPNIVNGSNPVNVQPNIPVNNVSYWSLPKKGQLAFLCLARLADPIAMTSVSVRSALFVSLCFVLSHFLDGYVKAVRHFHADVPKPFFGNPKGWILAATRALTPANLWLPVLPSCLAEPLQWFDPSQSPAAISTQAGILIGAKTAAQVCTGMFWGRLADSEFGGRKLVLSVGLISAGVSMLGYGFSRSFTSAIIWQTINGFMNANVSMVRCMVAELNPEKRYRTRALLLLPLCANAGILLGPLIGGFLASNNTHTDEGSPSSRYPYATPNIVIALVYAIAALGVIFGVEETLESFQDGGGSFAARIYQKMKQKIRDQNTVKLGSSGVLTSEGRDNHPEADTSEAHTATNSSSPLLGHRATKKQRKLPFHRIWTFNVICTLLSTFIISGHIGTFVAMWAIFLSTPAANADSQHPPIHFTGGLGMNPRSVGFAMSLLGAIGVLLQAAIYPPLNDRYGTVKVWRAAMFVFPFVYLLAPFPALVASASSLHGPTKVALTWVAMSTILFLYVVGRTGTTPATALLINDCTPHPSVRGTIHTAGTMVGNLSRSVFPVMALTIFGRGLDIGVVGLGFWCIMFLAILACVASRWVTEGTNGKEIVLEDEEDEVEGQSDEAQRQSPNGKSYRKIV